MAYPHKWSPISYKSSAGQRKHIGQRPMLYRWTTPPTKASLLGPLTLLIFINDFNEEINSHISKSADDTKIFKEVSNSAVLFTN